MDLLWAAGGAAVGLPGGAVMRGTVFRLSVPSGEPDRTACGYCALPVRRWWALRCSHCGASPGVPAALELTTSAVLFLLLGRFGGQPEAPAYAFFGVLGVALSAIDLSVQRLPDRLVLPAYPMLLAFLTIAAIVRGNSSALLRATLAGLALAGIYFALALVSRGRIGGGDIKLAGLVGLALGWLGWPALVAGAALAFLFSGLTSLVLLAANRISMTSDISFGPFMLSGALVSLLAYGHPL